MTGTRRSRPSLLTIPYQPLFWQPPRPDPPLFLLFNPSDTFAALCWLDHRFETGNFLSERNDFVSRSGLGACNFPVRATVGRTNTRSLFSASNVRTVSSSNLMDTLGYNDPTRGVYHVTEKTLRRSFARSSTRPAASSPPKKRSALFWKDFAGKRHAEWVMRPYKNGRQFPAVVMATSLSNSAFPRREFKSGSSSMYGLENPFSTARRRCVKAFFSSPRTALRQARL